MHPVYNKNNKKQFSSLIRCHNNAKRWKYAISTGNFLLIRIYFKFHKNDMVTFEKPKNLVSPTVKE